jgi:hypothetical protein
MFGQSSLRCIEVSSSSHLIRPRAAPARQAAEFDEGQLVKSVAPTSSKGDPKIRDSSLEINCIIWSGRGGAVRGVCLLVSLVSRRSPLNGSAVEASWKAEPPI